MENQAYLTFFFLIVDSVWAFFLHVSILSFDHDVTGAFLRIGYDMNTNITLHYVTSAFVSFMGCQCCNVLT